LGTALFARSSGVHFRLHHSCSHATVLGYAVLDWTFAFFCHQWPLSTRTGSDLQQQTSEAHFVLCQQGALLCVMVPGVLTTETLLIDNAVLHMYLARMSHEYHSNHSHRSVAASEYVHCILSQELFCSRHSLSHSLSHLLLPATCI
jgi:hypothetical protein